MGEIEMKKRRKTAAQQWDDDIDAIAEDYEACRLGQDEYGPDYGHDSAGFPLEDGPGIDPMCADPIRGDDTNMIERIQQYMAEGYEVVAAIGLEIVGEGDSALFPFKYKLRNVPGSYRGAFTNGDPIWEEDDAEAFQRAIGEIE
jgi:hypothetical protein